MGVPFSFLIIHPKNIKTMITLTIINTFAILFIFVHLGIIKFSIRKDTTTYGNKLTGYDCWIMSKYFRIPVRNNKKTALHEEVCRLIGLESQHSKRQILSAKLSWLKTIEEVNQFEKDYSVVDEKLVSDLVSKYRMV